MLRTPAQRRRRTLALDAQNISQTIQPVQPPASVAVTPTAAAAPVGYQSSAEGYKKVTDAYEYWTGKLTDTSMQLSYGVIAANWTVFGSANQVLHNRYSKWSLALVLFSLGVNLFGSWLLGELNHARAVGAEKRSSEWNVEWERYKNQTNPLWPFTRSIKAIALIMRQIKVWFPLIGGGLFLIALLRR